LDKQGGALSGVGQVRHRDIVRVSNDRSGLRYDGQVQFGGRVSKEFGSRVASAEWHSSEVVEYRNKASFYVTNFLDNMPLFRFR